MATIECVPNISEARRHSVIDEGADAVRATGARLLDIHGDVDHNRSVFTITGSPDAVQQAAFALADVAVARIDLRLQQGAHPRVGAIDVVPFVPITDLTLDDCVAVARTVGAEIARRHDLPVFLYEAAAAAPHRRRLEDIRRGGLAGLESRMDSADWKPDFGPSRPHPTAGVAVVGARVPLVAYNVDLSTDRLDIASAIASVVRESSGGLPHVKALGVALPHRGIVQVSMNLTDFRVTSIRTAFDLVLREAARRGVTVLDSEIVGLVPAAALPDSDVQHLRIRGYDGSQLLERRLAARD